jgi:hypothetical protein
MKCDLVLHDVDYIVLPNIQILAILLDSLGLVEEGGEEIAIEETSLSEALRFALDMAREYYRMQSAQHDGDCAVDVKYRAYYQRICEAMVQLEAVLSDGPDITDADWAEIEALGTAPASDESASGAESETA